MTAITDDELAEAIVAAIGDKSKDGLSPQGEAAVRLAMRVVALNKELLLKEPLQPIPIEEMSGVYAGMDVEVVDGEAKPNIDTEPNPPRNSDLDLVGEGLEKAKQAVLDARNNPQDLEADF